MEAGLDCSILLSIYKPRWEWLEKQLRTIEEQTFQNKKLIIWIDDPDDTTTIHKINSLNLSIPYSTDQGDNLGYAKAFEHLVTLADTKYIAFCDQDDLWDNDKLEKMICALECEEGVLATSDRRIIDEHDVILVHSDCKEFPSVLNSWNTGDDITVRAATRCMALGMTIVMRRDIALAALPVSLYTGHDKWFALVASAKGKCVFIKEPLVSYRRHNSNVSGLFAGITSKEDYYKQRIETSYMLAKDFCDRYSESNSKYMIMKYAEARYYGRIFQLFKMRSIAPNISYFEIFYHFVPKGLFAFVIQYIKKHSR